MTVLFFILFVVSLACVIWEKLTVAEYKQRCINLSNELLRKPILPSEEVYMKVSLPKLYKELLTGSPINPPEAGKREVCASEIAELFGILGRRWRQMTDDQWLAEAAAIRMRAGRQSKSE